MSQRLSSASSASLFLLVVLSALVAPSLSKILLDYRIPPTAKVTDMGDKTTALGKLTKATITGKNSLTEAYQFMKDSVAMTLCPSITQSFSKQERRPIIM
ncbi:hypothetical protein PGTUg99_023237 [Puccinia graminis f. sp. tritici]|uniref:Uncharacterized protein n=1 Tax=Puccinia graminis f. sp. tritici TaxID=56615 RepID=A0A5B0R5K2_PUCGR|nr:hypothetical protein PGTUg99_023237 [Puccinia graminis f. sp. tritici]